MRLVDSHCHLEYEGYKDNLDQIIQDARSAGIVKLLTSSVVPEEWDLSKQIAEKYPEVEFALGIHPWYVEESMFDALPALSQANTRGAVAIGEIGLDKKILAPSLETQIAFFEAQLEIARDLGLPVVLHCRGAFNELISSIKRVGAVKSGGIVHSFSGSIDIAEILIGLNYSFSFGGALTYRNSRKKAEVLKRIFPDYFLLETDSPDIPPVEIKEGRNLPKYILYNLGAASDILGIAAEDIAEAATNNAYRIFKL